MALPANKFSENHPSNPFRFLYNHRKAISWILIFSFFNLLVSCYYFRVKTKPVNLESISQINKDRKYIILHNDKEAWHFYDIRIDENTKQLYGNLESVDSRHFEFKDRYPPNEAPRYKPGKSNPTIEAHIRASHLDLKDFPHVTVPLSSINRIDVYDEAMGKSIFSFIGITLGVIVSLIVVIAIIVVLTKSSCPFVYTFDGEQYHFAGELYPGAVYSNIEKDDYLPLPDLKAVNGKYDIQICNELKEKQYTDLAELLVAQHPQNTAVLLDKNGRLHSLEAPEPPLQALDSENNDFRSAIVKADSNFYLFNEDKETCSLRLNFKKKKDCQFGKLILTAKNSYWLDYLFGKFNEQFGSRFNEFQEYNSKLPAQRIREWSKEQAIPLQVYLKAKNKWQLVDHFELTGPLASRELVMPIDLRKVEEDTVHIKLECGFMFWEIDYAAMDFSENKPIALHTLSPETATDENGSDVRKQLHAKDKNYLFQPEAGNRSRITYASIPETPGLQTTVFLHSRGYYEYIRDYSGEPDLKKLKTFKKKGALPAFSKQLYREFAHSNSLLATASGTK